MGKKLSQVLKEAGILLESRGEKFEGKPADREVKKEPGPRAKKLRDLYYQTLSSADNEFPSWYSRSISVLYLRPVGPVNRREKSRKDCPMIQSG
jgi:4-hydroxyphenylacetate decarboxylase large subunit